MLDGKAIQHGGSLASARRMFPSAPEPWIDLSTGINPHSYPLFDLPATAFSRLPEPTRIDDLAALAATVYGTPSARNVAAAPGTQILLPMIAALVPPGTAGVSAPTYAEHRRAAEIAGHVVEDVTDFDALAEADLAIVVNPNNPDGKVVTRDALLELAGHQSRKGGMLVVDEAFMEVGPRQESVAGDVRLGSLVVLKSFGKFFGMAGLRLGFALAAEPVATRLSARLGPWAVAGPALEVGLKALADTGWQETMRQRLAAGAARLDDLLDRSGLEIAGGTSLFRYVRHGRAGALFETLGARGLLVRRFDFDATVLRVGLPGSVEAWERLAAGLGAWQGAAS